MKALSVKQPFASLIAEGLKTIETRTWPTSYRGDLLICASASAHKYWLEIVNLIAYKQVCNEIMVNNPPFGKALCVAELWDVKLMKPHDSLVAGCDYYEGAYSWHLRNIRKIEPFAVKGQLGLYKVDNQLIRYL